MQNSPDYNPDLSYLPLYYRNFYQPPVCSHFTINFQIFVQENATIKISNISMYRMLQYAYVSLLMFNFCTVQQFFVYYYSSLFQETSRVWDNRKGIQLINQIVVDQIQQYL